MRTGTAFLGCCINATLYLKSGSTHQRAETRDASRAAAGAGGPLIHRGGAHLRKPMWRSRVTHDTHHAAVRSIDRS